MFFLAYRVVGHGILNREQGFYSREQGCCSLCLTCWVIDRNTGLSASGVADTRGMGFCITRGVVAHSVVMCVVCWVFISRIDLWGENLFEPHCACVCIDLWGENLFEPHCACVCARPSFVNAVQHVV